MSPLTTVTSPLSVKDTVEKLSVLLGQKGMKVFALIDHAAAAREAGLEMADEVVVLFGDPKSGTHLMIEAPAIGLELPLKIVVWREENTKVGYKEPKLLIDEYQIEEHRVIVERMTVLMAYLVKELE
jgi:uncharacterized protein (DUF302 family)